MEEQFPSNDELCKVADEAFHRFRGNSENLRSAIGYAFIARQVGWKPALVMCTQKTVKDYDKILGIDSRTFFPEIGPNAQRSHAWRLAQKVSNFWKAVKGEIKGIRSPNLE